MIIITDNIDSRSFWNFLGFDDIDYLVDENILRVFLFIYIQVLERSASHASEPVWKLT